MQVITTCSEQVQPDRAISDAPIPAGSKDRFYQAFNPVGPLQINMPTTKTGKRSKDYDDEGDDGPLLAGWELPISKNRAATTLETKALGVSILLNVFLAVLLVFAVWLLLSQRLQYGRSTDFDFNTPAYEAIEYVPRVFTKAFLDDQSPYQGWPDDEKDQLWQNMYSKAADRLVNKTEHAPVAGFEKDYVVGLDVFHQLHCLNMIRRSMYPKRYNSSIIREDGSIDFLTWAHLDHCVEMLRESLTCSADVSVIPYRWHRETNIAEPDIRSVHMCRNFTKIRDWAFERFLSLTSKRIHVENGTVVDYAGAGRDPEEVLAEKLANPENWNKTVKDL
ncbi:hypothetical protein CCM_06496 [Cordyceps militaris CM01]|uniref:Tat pathway signal sequence n=1 Tax=Cordyceps militaris (strain CM01) TaxID=983644 RepID=G3JMP0_CORMM|nr:uncharacterized protein CCM_06496 [Cordyceps militaris CM01]EGX90076.1 hypothetical protein CCM_06496 [Cordyceps militaris CM01]